LRLLARRVIIEAPGCNQSETAADVADKQASRRLRDRLAAARGEYSSAGRGSIPAAARLLN